MEDKMQCSLAIYVRENVNIVFSHSLLMQYNVLLIFS